MARRDLTDAEAAPRVARPLADVEIDDVTVERIARAIVAMSSAHALGLEYNGVAPDPGDVRAAADWFRENSPGYRVLCLAAGLNPAFLRREIWSRLGAAEVDS